MSYSDIDRAKWRKVLISSLISSDESELEDGDPALVVKELPWRAAKVAHFFKKMDQAHDARKSEQAIRQTKKRIYGRKESNRQAPVNVPTWAISKN